MSENGRGHVVQSGRKMDVEALLYGTESYRTKNAGMAALRLLSGGSVKPEKPKKVYIPNVNVQRNKKKDEATPVKVEATKPNNKDRGRGRGRGDSRHGRNKGNIIQSAGIWSEGIFTAPTVSRRSYDSSSSTSRSAAKYLEKSKLDTNKFIINTEEEEKLKKLLNNDLDDDANPDDKLDPISLPRIVKKEFCDEEIDIKPIISENDEVINIKEETLSEQNKKEFTIPQIIENKTNPYILIQFPDCWQNVESNNEGSKPKGPDGSNTCNENDNKTKSESHGLNSFKSGQLGKLEILKSGKTRLCIGEKYFSIGIKVQKDFQQELLVAKIDTISLTGDLVNLGLVNNHLLCSPDDGIMLKNLIK